MKIIIPILFLISCFNKPSPQWIMKLEKEEGYWYGIGRVEKPFLGHDIRAEVRSQAINEISSQISINISASFKQVITENNLSIDEVTESIIKTRTDLNNLSNIEIIEKFEDKNHYFLLVRLSKKLYYESINKQRQNAIKTAIEFIDKAESNFNFQSFGYISEAMKEIMPYIDSPLKVEYPIKSGNIVNLYSYIKLLANTYSNRLNLIIDKEVIEIKLGFSQKNQLNINVRDEKNTPLLKVPIYCYIDEKNKGSFMLSDKEGKCIFSVPPLSDRKSLHYVNYEVNMEGMIASWKLFGNLPKIQTQSVIKIIPAKIFIEIIENKLGQSTINPYVKPIIIEHFSNNFSANFNDSDEPDLIIKGMINTRSISDIPNEYGIYQVFGDITITILNGLTEEIMIEKSYNKIQGSSFQSNEEAASQSLQKISHIIKDEFLPEIVEMIKSK